MINNWYADNTAGPHPLTTNLTLVFTGTAPMTIEVDFDDGSDLETFTNITTSPFVVEHTYTASGTYHPVATISNSCGSDEKYTSAIDVF